MPKEKQKFEVGLKAFIIKKNSLLIVQDSKTSKWEVPGGRIDKGEENSPIEKILFRELNEELGEDFKIKLGPIFTSWIRATQKGFLFLVGWIAWYQRGEIKLSPEHIRYQWVDEKSWQKIDLFSDYKDEKAIGEFWKKI